MEGYAGAWEFENGVGITAPHIIDIGVLYLLVKLGDGVVGFDLR